MDPPFDMNPNEETTRKVEHLFVFVHGFGSSGARHGVYVMERIDAAFADVGGWTHIATSNSQGTGLGTFFKTAAGIETGGTRLAKEVKSLTVSHPTVRTVSFIGSSLGGLYSRYAAGLLFNLESFSKYTDTKAPELSQKTESSDEEDIALGPGIDLGVLVTLATPHLGIRCLYSGWNRWMLSWIQTGKELLLEDHRNATHCILSRLSCEDKFMAALKRFKVRLSYAPLQDDGIVAYPASAMRPDRKSYVSRLAAAEESKGVIVSESGLEIAAEKKEGEDEYFTGDAKAGEIRSMCRRLAGVGWKVVDVDLKHSRLATLYPSTETRENTYSLEVMDHMINVLAAQKVLFSESDETPPPLL